MANYRQKTRRYANNAWRRTRTVYKTLVQRVRPARKRNVSFLKKYKTPLIITALALGAYMYKDKIKSLITKK